MLPLRDLNPHRRKPYLTWALVAVNVFVFFFVQPSGFTNANPQANETREQQRFLYENALVPCEVSHWQRLTEQLARECSGFAAVGADTTPAFPDKSVGRSILASMFLHANLLHLLGNMWFLWVFGDNVEDRLGHVAFAAFYLFGGVVAAFGQVLSDPQSLTPVIGASGAIAAVLGAYLVFYPRAKVVTILLPLFFLPFVISAWVLLGFWFGSQFLTAPGSGVAWVAHVAGFAAGAVGAMIVRTVTRPPAPPAETGYAF
jgi:membrane associated rhomboid family serine protease